MSQASVAGEYFNSNLFSNYYLDERVYDLDAWDCDEAAREAMTELQSLYDREGELLPDRKEDAVIDRWIDPVLDVLGFDSAPEATLPDGGGYVDRTLFGSDGELLAAELDEKIERTDALIDELVYELYGLTDEEIEIVEAAVGD